jgi:phosphatidate cytidylyltransferase
MLDQALKKRIITGVSIALVFALLFFLGIATEVGKLVLPYIVLLILSFAIFEYVSFSRVISKNIFTRLATALILVAPSALFLVSQQTADLSSRLQTLPDLNSLLLYLLLGYLTLNLFSLLFFTRDENQDLMQAPLLELSLAYFSLTVGGACAIAILFIAGYFMFFIGFILLVMLTDITAYFAGKKFGGLKLAPAVSPGKTFSGGVAALLSSVLVGVLLAVKNGAEGYFYIVSILSMLVVSLAAQVGDLNQSYLKRLAGVKDSGDILPGHGGVFDRVDGYLGAAPYYLLIIYL